MRIVVLLFLWLASVEAQTSPLCGQLTGVPCLAGRSGTANNWLISTDSEGVITGSTSPTGNGLTLESNSNAGLTPNLSTIRIRPSATLVNGGLFTLSASMPSLVLNSTSAKVYGYTVGIDNAGISTWPVKANLSAGGGGGAFLVGSPIIQNSPTTTARNAGNWQFIANDISFQGDGATLTVPEVITVYEGTQIGGINSGNVTVTAMTTVKSDIQPSLGTISTRRGFWYRDQNAGTATVAAIPTSVALDVDAQTSTGAFTAVAAVRSAIAAATNAWTILGTGTAVSALTGGLRIGDNTAPTDKLEVLGNILLDNTGTANGLKFKGTSTGTTTVKAGAQGATNITWTLPTAQGATNTFVKNNGSGALSWNLLTASDLPDTTVSPGSYGGAATVATFTVDQQGRLTSAGESTISIDAAAIASGTIATARIPKQYTYAMATTIRTGAGGL